ncbi:MAG: MATE family efflux transporter [Spirochaetaceae bacterium]|nr:MAG: MATE family efflux transporter [Spirochaetaceae bacterium]
MNGNVRNPPDVTNGSVGRHIFRLTVPTVWGMFGITIFNLTDTFFVSRLGTDALAAMGFTFPVIMVTGAVSMGMALGAGSVLARAMGRGDHHTMSRTATDGILLSILTVLVISTVGLLTMEPLFTLLGADATTLPLVKEYMSIWYIGVVAFIMPPVGDSSMRAMGDMKRPLIVMAVCAILNVILDPIMIFGLFGFPAMGIAGASLATVISRAAGMITTLSFLHFHYGLIEFRYKNVRELFESWKRILHVGIPGAVVRVAPQILRAVVTRMAATVGGITAVAAVAAGSRIESFALIVGMAIGTALVPITGQNWGAERFDRVDRTRVLLNRTAFVYGAVAFLLAIPLAGPVARIFTADVELVSHIQWYLWIVTLGLVGLNLYNWTSEQLNAAGKPRWVLLINLGGTTCILIPLTLLGAFAFGYRGMLAGLAAGQLVLGGVACVVGRRHLRGVASTIAPAGHPITTAPRQTPRGSS